MYKDEQLLANLVLLLAMFRVIITTYQVSFATTAVLLRNRNLEWGVELVMLIVWRGNHETKKADLQCFVRRGDIIIDTEAGISRMKNNSDTAIKMTIISAKIIVHAQ